MKRKDAKPGFMNYWNYLNLQVFRSLKAWQSKVSGELKGNGKDEGWMGNEVHCLVWENVKILTWM